MNKQELQEWFYEKLFNCYWVKHKTDPNIKYLVYDKQFIRDCKLSSVLGGNITFPTEHIGDVLFRRDLKNKIFYCDYDIIWSFLMSNYQNNYNEIRDLVKGFLGEIDKNSAYTPIDIVVMYVSDLGDIDKNSAYTPKFTMNILKIKRDIDKNNEYTL